MSEPKIKKLIVLGLDANMSGLIEKIPIPKDAEGGISFDVINKSTKNI